MVTCSSVWTPIFTFPVTCPVTGRPDGRTNRDHLSASPASNQRPEHDSVRPPKFEDNAMKRYLVLGLLAAFSATPAFAALKPGDMAPDFTAQGSLGGQPFTF